MKKRVEHIDLIRVFACLSVIAIHINAITRDNFITNNKTYYALFTLLDSFTRAGVPLFLMLTGYFVLKKEEDYKTFIKKKMPKLIIPFILFSFVYYLYLVYDTNISFNILNFIKRLFNNEIYYHLWYMYTIILIYLFIPYEKVLVDNLKQKDLLRLIITTFIIGNLFLTINLLTKRYNHPFLSACLLPNLIIYNNYVLLGHYLSKYDFKNKKLIYILGLISVLFMPIVDLFFIDGNVRNDVMLTATSILPVFYTLGIYYLIKDNYDKLKINKKVKKLIENYSRLSLYIYLSHVLVMNITVKILSNYWIYDRFVENILFTIIVFIITAIVSYFISIIFDLLYNKIENRIKRKA